MIRELPISPDMADPDPSQSFFFADHLILDDSPTRSFYAKLLQGLIHKNNNMLGVIQGFSSLILMDDGVSKSVRENVQQMKDSSQGVSELSRTILTTAGSARVQIEDTNLNDSLPYFEQTQQSLAEQHGVNIQFNRPENLPIVQADSNRLNEILRELLANAIQSAGELSPKGEVAVDVFPPGEAFEGNNVNIFIRNSSVDIPAEKIPELFDPFSGTRGPEHEGNGLTTAAVLAGQMGMKLGMRNADGTTTVWLSIPA